MATPPLRCCEALAGQVDWECGEHVQCPEKILLATDGGGVGILAQDGSPAYFPIAFCPWCGARLPGSED